MMALPKSLSARITLERFFSGMNHLVLFQMMALSERLSARSTSVWFFASVSSFVGPQMSNLIKGFGAEITTEWFFAVVLTTALSGKVPGLIGYLFFIRFRV